MNVEQHLREAGLSQDQIQQILEGMERLFGRVGLRTVSENLLTDLRTGKLRITRATEAEYRRLFTQAGMRLDDYLDNREAFFRAFRIANSVEFARLTSENIGRPERDR